MIHQFAGCAQARQRTARQSWIKGHFVRSAAAKKIEAVLLFCCCGKTIYRAGFVQFLISFACFEM